MSTFKITSLIHKLLVSCSTSPERILITGSDNYHMTRVQEAPAEMKDALYQIVNQVIQNRKMPTSWEGTHHTHPKEGWRGKILGSIRPICLMDTAAKIVTSAKRGAKTKIVTSAKRGAKRFSKSQEQQSVFEDPQEGFLPDRKTPPKWQKNDLVSGAHGQAGSWRG